MAIWALRTLCVLALFSVGCTGSCRDEGAAAWDLPEPLVDPIPADARELIVFHDGANRVELFDPETNTAAILIGDGSVTGLHGAPVGGEGVLMVATIVQTAAPPPGDRRDEMVVFDATDGARLASAPISERDWTCSPFYVSGSGWVGARTFWLMTTKSNPCDDGSNDLQRLHVINAEEGEVAVHPVPRGTRVFGPVDDGASLFVMRPSGTDSWLSGTLDVHTGTIEFGEPFELFQAAEPFVMSDGPSVYGMGGIVDDIDLVRAWPDGTSQVVTSFTDKGHGKLLGRTVSGELYARLDDGVHRVLGDSPGLVRLAPPDPSTPVAVAPAGTYLVEAGEETLSVASTEDDTSVSLEYREGEPWYQANTGCFYGAGPIVIAPNSSAFLLSSKDGPIAGICPDVEGAPPPEPHPGSWLVKPSDLSYVVLDEVGPAPTFSPSGEYVAYAARASEGCVELALRRTDEPNLEQVVAESECGVNSGPLWVLVR